MNEEERKAHYKQMGAMWTWGGWVLAFLALWLGGHLLSRMNNHMNKLKAENNILKTELATYQAEAGPAAERPARPGQPLTQPRRRGAGK